MMYTQTTTAQVYLQKLLAGNTALRKEAHLSSCGSLTGMTLEHG